MRFLVIALIMIIARVAVAGKTPGGDTRVIMAYDSDVHPDSVMTGEDVRQKVYRGKYHMATADGDSVLMLVMNEVTIFPPMKFKNKKQEQFYWRTVRDVKKTLPYAKLICSTLLETYEYIETFPTQKEREEYLKKMEKDVFEQYKPALRQFTKSQARLLVKLIQRETNQSGYDILKAFLGTFRAGFWQAFGKLFGVNLKGQYHPESNSDDAIIERVCVAVEQGAI